jgi:hypothetical protein
MPALAMAPRRVPTYGPGDEAVTSTYIEALKRIFEERDRSEYWRSAQQFDEAWMQLQKLGDLGSNWDSYEAEAPSESARNTAARILSLLVLLSLAPTRIVASSEGGVGICFVNEDRYADFECFNTGEILAVRYRGTGEPYARDVSPEDEAIKTSIEQIRAHFTA